MAKLTVIVDNAAGGERRQIKFIRGASVREVLESAGLRPRSGCLGNGACGLCLVRVEAGPAEPLSRNERLLLSPEQIAAGMRLACQLAPEDDLTVRIVNQDPLPVWRNLKAAEATSGLIERLADENGDGAGAAASGLGLAVDIGTTHLSVSLWDLRHRRRLGSRIGLNPQMKYGADVMTRLESAAGSPEAAGEMARLPLSAIAGAVRQICASGSEKPEDVTRAVIVGNTPMMTLLAGGDPRDLLDPASWDQPAGKLSPDMNRWPAWLGISNKAEIELAPSLGAFVGSDLLAGVLATDLLREPASLLVDFGTNAELALWDGSRLWVTSAACGPAFEGCGISCGLPAETGAIFRFEGNGAGLEYLVIGGGDPKGICGTGLVDLIAYMREREILTDTGRIAAGAADAFDFAGADVPLRLTKADIDIFQQAKAAIATGMMTLLTAAGLPAAGLKRICVAGAFGRGLDLNNAQSVGLLPAAPAERIELTGNSALAGCEYLLLAPAAAAEAVKLGGIAEIVNLSQTPGFEDLYFENLFIRPQGGGSRE